MITKESRNQQQSNTNVREIELREINKHYEFVKKTMESWPMWKKEIYQKLLHNSLSTMK